MKVVAKPVEVVAWFSQKGEPNPVRLRITNQDETYSVIKVDKVKLKEKEGFMGSVTYVFECQSIVNGVLKPFQLKYELSTCKWMLWKI